MQRNDDPEPQHEIAVALLPTPRHYPGRSDSPMMLKAQPQHEIAPALRRPVEASPQLTESLVPLQSRCDAAAPLLIVGPMATGLG